MNAYHQKNKSYGYLFIPIFLLLLFFHPVIFSQKTFFFRDIHRWFYPMKFFLADSLKDGTIPYWSSHYFCGAPFMSDFQSGVFYPLSWIFSLLPFPFSLNAFIILHLFFGFYFFYHFIKGIGLTRGSAILTSISYCFGGYTLASINTLNNLSTLIWLPLILWSFQKARTGESNSGYLITVGALCMAILGGEPQLFLLSAVLLLFFGITIVPLKMTARIGLKNMAIIIAVTFWAILITMIQVGPGFIDYTLSARFGGITYEEATRFSLDWGMIKHLLLPFQFPSDFATNPDTLNHFFPGKAEVPWLLSLYPGVMILPVAVFGLLFNASKKVWFWFALFLIALILSLGRNTPVYTVFYKIFPIFRFPAKFILLSSFSLLVMASYGFDTLFSVLRKRRARFNLFFSMILVILALDLFTAHRHMNPFKESSFYKTHHPLLKPIISDPETFRIYVDPEPSKERSKPNSILNRHAEWQMLLMPNLGILFDLDHVGGTSGLELRYQYFITEILLKPWHEKIHFLRLANVKYIISSQRLDRNPELQGKVEKINALVYRLKGSLPRAWVVGRLQAFKKGTMDELVNNAFDPATTALAKAEFIAGYHHPAFQEVDRIHYEKGRRIHLELTAQNPGVVVLSESSYPGWRVYVNGEEKEPLWLNLLFQGIGVERGKHEIDFIFRPPRFSLFASISFISLVLFFIIGLRLLITYRGKNK